MRWLVTGALAALLSGLLAGAEEAPVKGEQVVLAESFDDVPDGPLPAGWWAEGGEAVTIREGRLHIQSDPPQRGAAGSVCTVWNATPLPGNVRVEFDAQVTASSFDANNINVFLLYADPSGRPLSATRESRASGDYKLYHQLNGYIFTFLNDWQAEAGRLPDGGTKARFRMRRCPGFRLLTETYDSTCRQGITYHVTITKQGGDITFAVDGRVYLRQRDPEPWTSGLLGLRTYHTNLWWDNLRVVALPAT